MKERSPQRPLIPGFNFIPCTALYAAMRGYNCHGGRYDSAQSVLAVNGWHYLIGVDGWVSPERQRGD